MPLWYKSIILFGRSADFVAIAAPVDVYSNWLFCKNAFPPVFFQSHSVKLSPVRSLTCSWSAWSLLQSRRKGVTNRNFGDPSCSRFQKGYSTCGKLWNASACGKQNNDSHACFMSTTQKLSIYLPIDLMFQQWGYFHLVFCVRQLPSFLLLHYDLSQGEFGLFLSYFLSVWISFLSHHPRDRFALQSSIATN